MQRRPRIKAVANLSATRRSANKSNSESQIKTSELNIESEKLEDKSKAVQNEVVEDVPAEATTASNEVVSSPKKTDVKINKLEISVHSNEISHDLEPPAKADVDVRYNSLSDNASTFKTPHQMPRNEKEATGSPQVTANKFRKFKIAPRLNASRNIAKSQQDDEKVKKSIETVVEEPLPTIEHEDSHDFAPPTPTKSRPETPRDILDSPNFTINHNISHPGAAPPSPFPYYPHARIRTESLCSMKSNREVTVANLQPRKNIRTEDQKIIDIKRESRERLSNKDLDKSKLRMFDMIYFNPQNNPMKPRSVNKTERPAKVELIEEPVKEEKLPEPPAAMLVPQLRLNANGDMVLDETSLVVENEQQKQTRILLANTNIVYDDDLSSGGYYKRQKRTRAWTEEETVKFYRVLNTVGPDFSLMLNLFPNRSRRDLKLKFKNEERYNAHLIDKALLKYNIFDLDGLQQEFDQEEADRRKEAEAKSNSEVKELVKRKILKKQEARLKAEKQAQSKIEKILTDGDLAMSSAESHILQTEIKENLDSTVQSAPKSRQNRKRLQSETTTVPTTEPENLGWIHELSTAPKRPRKSRKKTEKDIKKTDKTDLSFQKVMQPSTSTVSYQTTERFAAKDDAKVNLPAFDCTFNTETPTTPISEPNIQMMQIVNAEAFNFHDTSSPTPFFYDESNNRIADLPVMMPGIVDTSEAVIIPQPEAQNDENMEVTTNEKSTKGSNKCQTAQNIDLNTPTPEVSTDVPSTEKAAPTAKDQQPEPEAPTANPVTHLEKEIKPKPKVKSRKNKFKPTLVKRLKLDADGEVVVDDTTISSTENTNLQPENENSTIILSSNQTIDIQQLKTSLPIESSSNECPTSEANESTVNSELIESNLETLTNKEVASQVVDEQNKTLNEMDVPLDENLNETSGKSTDVESIVFNDEEPSTSSEFDEESFLDSLDLEKLVLVEANRNGKDVYEIHEINPVTQEIGDKPMDLPSRLVDLIISVMTQHEEGED